MTERMTPEKQEIMKHAIDQLNVELYPLMVKAVLIDPIASGMALTTTTHLNVLKNVLSMIQELISLVVEQ